MTDRPPGERGSAAPAGDAVARLLDSEAVRAADVRVREWLVKILRHVERSSG